MRNVSKNKNFEFSHNLKWYIIPISFERVLRNIQKILLLIENSAVNTHRRTWQMLSGGEGGVESLPEFLWLRIVIKLPEFNLFSDKSAPISMVFQNLRGEGGSTTTVCMQPFSQVYNIGVRDRAQEGGGGNCNLRIL